MQCAHSLVPSLCPVSMAGVQRLQWRPDRLCPQALIISRRERNERRKNTQEVCLVQPAGAGEGTCPNFQGLLRGPWVFLASLPSRLLELHFLSESCSWPPSPSQTPASWLDVRTPAASRPWAPPGLEGCLAALGPPASRLLPSPGLSPRPSPLLVAGL